MTTTVTVSAHCDPDTTKVEVRLSDENSPDIVSTLQDGESEDFHVYDYRAISVKEVKK